MGKANIRKIDITKIIDGLKLLTSKGLSAKEIEIIVKNIIANPEYRANFLRDPFIAVRQIHAEKH